MGRATAHSLAARPGVKRSNIITFQLQSQFQGILYQTLCVFSQIKDIKHIERDFRSVNWVIPLGAKKCFWTWLCGKSR